MQEDSKRKLITGLVVMILGMTGILVSDYLIRRFFPERIILNDLMFRLVPNIPFLSIVADGIVSFGFLITLLWFTERKIPRFGEFAFAFGMMLLIRSILNLVTPIGDPSGDSVTYGFLERTPLMGMFPSGHIASLNFEYWLIRYWKTGKSWERLFIILIAIEAFALLSTRGHYSIDIAGGIALGYFAVKLMKHYL